jgi:hypothetical protein
LEERAEGSEKEKGDGLDSFCEQMRGREGAANVGRGRSESADGLGRGLDSGEASRKGQKGRREKRQAV